MKWTSAITIANFLIICLKVPFPTAIKHRGCSRWLDTVIMPEARWPRSLAIISTNLEHHKYVRDTNRIRMNQQFQKISTEPIVSALVMTKIFITQSLFTIRNENCNIMIPSLKQGYLISAQNSWILNVFVSTPYINGTTGNNASNYTASLSIIIQDFV